MPIGSFTQENGLLLQSGSGLILQRDDGGRWRLDAPLRAERLIGRRVTVVATRSGFDLLDVHQLYPEGGKPVQPFVLSWQFGAGAASVFGLLVLITVILSNR